jgi:pilus assembly protein CpaE
MSTMTPSVLILGADAKTQAELTRALAEVGVVSAAPLEAAVALRGKSEGAPSVVLVHASEASPAICEVVRALADLGLRVVVVGAAKDPDLILEVMRAGAREFVLVTQPEELRRIVREQAKPAEDAGPRGSVVTIFPTRGGVGATTIGTNLAGAIERAGERVCLVDVDLHLGDVLSFLDLPATYSITDVLANMGRLDRDLLDASILRHPSGIRVLAQSGNLEDSERVRPTDVAPLLGFLRRHYDRVVIDGVRGFDELSLAVLDASQTILLLLTQDVPAVRNAKRCLDLFRRLGYGDGKIAVVLNRYLRTSQLTPEVIADTLGLPVAHTLANDYGASIEAINRGLMLADVAPRSKLTKDIEALAPLGGGSRPEGTRKAGFLRGLLGRKVDNGSARAS